MAVKVVDASAIAAILFNEPQSAEMADKLDLASLIAPALFWFEMASICLKKLAILYRPLAHQPSFFCI